MMSWLRTIRLLQCVVAGVFRRRTPVMHAAGMLAVGCGVMLGLSACEEDVVAVVGTDLPYTVYGVLSPQLDSQWVRVFPVETRLAPAKPEPLDAYVTSVDRTTGGEYVWKDSIIVDFADQFAHVFHAPFQARYGHAYRIAVRRSDGAESSVEVTVPGETEIILQEPVIRFGQSVQPVLIQGDAPAILQVEVDYAIAFRANDTADIESARIVIPYVLRGERVDGGWHIPIDLREDFQGITASLAEQVDVGIDRQVGIILLNMTLRLIVGNEEWDPPLGVFDPDILVQPGLMRNVVNGFGFVGAGYRTHRQWTPPADLAQSAGFRPPGEG